MAAFLAGLASSLFGSALNYITGKLSSDEQFDNNKKLQHQQYLYNSQLQGAQNTFNAQQQERQNALTRELFGKQQSFNADQASLANERNRQNLEDSALLNRRGLQKAGYNINMLNGGFTPVASSPSPSASVDAPSPVGGGSASVGLPSSSLPLFGSIADLSSANLAMSNSKLANEKARELKIENDRKEHEDNKIDFYFNSYGYSFEKREDGSLSLNVLDDVNVEGKKTKYNKGDLDARNLVSALRANEAENTTKESTARFNNSVKEYQLAHPSIIRANAQLSEEEYNVLHRRFTNLLVEERVLDTTANLNISKKKLQDLEYKLQNENNTAEIIQKLFDGDVSFIDKLIALFTLFVNNVNVGIHN